MKEFSDLKNTALVFAPHPDDEVLGCGGTIAKKLSEGQDVSVVFVTDGRYSLEEFGISSSPSPLELKEIRREEAERAAKTLGLKKRDLIFLEIEDGTLEENRDIAQDKIIEVLKSFPTEVYFPQEKDFHPDHRALNRLVKNAIELLGLHPLEYEYIIAWSYPYNIIPRIRPQSLQNAIIARILRRDLIRIDITNYLHLKKAALKEYKSQVGLISEKQTRPVLTESLLSIALTNQEKFALKR